MQRFIILLTACFLLTACGGGGGGSRVVTPMDPMPTPMPTPPASVGDPDAFASTLARIVGPEEIPDVAVLQQSTPVFGSVAQNIYTAGSSPVRDVVTTFNGDRFTLNVTRQDGSAFTLDTDRDVVFDVVTYTPAENPVTDRPAVEGYVVSDQGGGRYVGGGAAIEWENTDFTNYLAAGFWVSIDLNTNPLTADVGAFIDGPDYDVTNVSLPIMGTATYTGRAAGAYVAEGGSDTMAPGANEAGQYAGDLSLTANFANMTIGGYVDNVTIFNVGIVLPNGDAFYDPAEEATNYRVIFGNSPINSNGTFTGSNITVTNPDFNIAETQGIWAGQFSSVDDSNGNPRATAGTNAAYFNTIGGSEAAFVGAWYGATEQFE